MINLNNLSMGFTNRTLFKDVSLSIFPKEKIGLTGPNGAGKTTLFSIILGEMEPLEGNVQIQKNINVGFLPQEASFSSDKTVLEELTEGDARIRKLMTEKRELEDTNKADTSRYGDVLEELEKLGIYDLEHKAEKILMGLGFKMADINRPVNELSGGWQMRTLLGKLLTYPYDLLLLDEPTNYLDLEATLWLKDYLSSYQGAFVLISHDRIFLNDVTNYTIILDKARMFKVKGNYEFFENQHQTNLKTLEKRKKVVDKKRKQLERFTQRFHAQPNRAAAVRNKRKQLERLEEIDLPQEDESIKEFEFPSISPSGHVVAHMEDISKSYGDKLVYEKLDFEITKGQKVCFVGPNGAGKSTLLKMLSGTIDPTSGTLKYGHKVSVGYFSQTRLDVLVPHRTALEEVAASAKNGTPTLQMRSLLGLFNFRGDDVFKHVNVLSGGEKSRLILAKLLINPPNFMLLDEPTTHLDVDGVKALTTAFQKYEGTACFISHDLFFIREVADTIVDIHSGQIKVYPGGLSYYLEKTGRGGSLSHKGQAQKKVEAPSSDQDKKSTKKDSKGEAVIKSSDSKNMKEIYEKHKSAKKRLSQIKNELKNLEKEKDELDVEMYAKSRKLSKAYEKRDSAIIKEFSKRVKDIQSRLREIEVIIQQLKEERTKISK